MASRRRTILVDSNQVKIIREIQGLYVKNFIAYKEQISHLAIRQVIKNCYRVADLFDRLCGEFEGSYLRREIEALENKQANGTGFSFGVEYEGVQVVIHFTLRDLGGFDYCLDHRINIHYCGKCKVKYGLKEKGDA